MNYTIISVIIPIYNSEKYLHRCFESILNQTFSDFELILINDGSQDNSGKICDEFALIDSRIHVFHQTNSGASAARNKGLELAKGAYVVFCDSDDIVSPFWLEHLYSASAPDTLPVCSFCNQDVELGKEKLLPIVSNKILTVDNYYNFSCCGIGGYMCNSLYSNSIIKEYNMQLREKRDQGDYNEDLLFNLQYVRHIKNIVYVGYSDYYYNIHDDSLSRSNQKYYFEKYEEKYQLWYNFLLEHKKNEYISQLSSSYIYHFLNSLNNEAYSKFVTIVNSPVVQTCVSELKDSNESARIINLIKNKKPLQLWFRYKLHELKGKLT